MSKLSHFSIRGLFTVTALSAALLAAPAQAQTITAVMHSSLRVLDPIITTAHITRNHGYMIYDTLLATDEQNRIQPQMLEGWKVSDDGKAYTFTLRDGLKWHDGQPVTAADCLASIKRWAQQDKMGQMVTDLLVDARVDDDKSFTMTFSEPGDLVLRALAKPSGIAPFIMPQRIAETPANQPIKEHVGSGPFRMVASEFRPGLQVVYEKNPDYVPRQEPISAMAGGKQVHVERVKWIATPDAMTSLNALISGEIDYLEQLPFDLEPLVANNDDITVRVLDSMGYQTVMRMNHLHKPFDDKRIRQAAMYAVNQESILQAQIGNPTYFRTCAALFGCGLPYESSAGEEISVKPDLEKARALLKEAGYDGTPVVILQPTDTPSVNTQPVVIAEALRAAGFTVDMQAMDWQTVVTRRAVQAPPSEGGWNIFATNNTMIEALDPLRAFGVVANGPKAWFGWPDVPAIETLRLEFARATEESQRKELAARIQQLVVEEGVLLPMGQYVVPAVYSKKLEGVLESPVPVFWNIRKSAD